uniref:CSC1/OSCA1-like 7TM region domain-containing protein n=1 Tax=Dendroctonus ponderosae TaxID=77166 RepID=A0AAR5PPA2_DENPD
MDSIGRLHSKFIIALVEASKLFPDSFSSIVPTVLFLGPLFALLYVQFRCTSNALYGWKTKICWDVIFHWLLFYISRVWFIFLSLCKLGVKYLDAAIQKRSIGPEVYYNTLICHCCVFLLVLTVSLLPCLILYLRHYSQREMPNFLMWVGEDPWIRSEIGISGHYLERPPRSDTYSPSKHNASYRSGRSSSVDTSAFLQKPSSLLRTCKSAVSVKKSNEEIVG